MNEVDHRCHVEGQWPERHVVIKAVQKKLDVLGREVLNALSKLEVANVIHTTPTKEQRLLIPQPILAGLLGRHLRTGVDPIDNFGSQHTDRIGKMLQEHYLETRPPAPHFDDFAARMRRRRGKT